MALRLPPEHAPRLFLDFVHSVVMSPDGRSYVLERDREEHRETLLTVPDVDTMVSEILRRAAHRAIQEARASLKTGTLGDSGPLRPISWAQLAYVWFTGFVVGAAVLAAVAIYLKKLTF